MIATSSIHCCRKPDYCHLVSLSVNKDLIEMKKKKNYGQNLRVSYYYRHKIFEKFFYHLGFILND